MNSQNRLTVADFEFGDDDDEEEPSPKLPRVGDNVLRPSLEQNVLQSPENIRSADEPATAMSMSPPLDLPDKSHKPACDPGMNLHQILHILEQHLANLRIYTSRIPSPMPSIFQVDDTLLFAQNRRLRFRGRSLLHERPHHKSTNRAKKFGANNFFSMNPRNQPSTEVLTTSNIPSGPNGSGSKVRATDPCNPLVFPLRFATLEPVLVRNIDLYWPNEMVVEICDAKHNQVDNFDLNKWKTEERYVESLQEEPDCRIIVICGYVVTWKHTSETQLRDVSLQYNLPYFSQPSSIEPDDDYGILGFFNGSGMCSIQIFTHPKSGLDPKEIVSGLPCALRGIAVPGNAFVVLGVLWPTPEPAVWPSLVQKPLHDMIFISGLDFADSVRNPLEYELFRDWLLGLLGGTSEQVHVVAPKRKLFIVGDCLGFSFHTEEFSEDESRRLRRAARRLDDFLDSLSDAIEIFIVPGRSDPTERSLPMRPFQPILLPKSFRRSNVHRLQDPCRMKIIVDMDYPEQYLDVVLSSGANVADIKHVTGDVIPSSVMAENTLKWGHLNPAAPDIYPVNGIPATDVFALTDRAPHLYVLGNQSYFNVREYKNTKIVSVPKFSLSHEALCLNLVNGSYRISPMQFSIGDVADSF